MANFVAQFGVGSIEHAADIDGSIWQTYGVVSQPSWAFINDDGSVETHLGALGVDGVSERLDALLAG